MNSIRQFPAMCCRCQAHPAEDSVIDRDAVLTYAEPRTNIAQAELLWKPSIISLGRLQAFLIRVKVPLCSACHAHLLRAAALRHAVLIALYASSALLTAWTHPDQAILAALGGLLIPLALIGPLPVFRLGVFARVWIGHLVDQATGSRLIRATVTHGPYLRGNERVTISFCNPAFQAEFEAFQARTAFRAMTGGAEMRPPRSPGSAADRPPLGGMDSSRT